MLRHALSVLVIALVVAFVLSPGRSNAGAGASATVTGGLGEGEIPVSWFQTAIVRASSFQQTGQTSPVEFVQVVPTPATHGVFIRSLRPERLNNASTTTLVVEINGNAVRRAHYRPTSTGGDAFILAEGIESPFLVRPGETMTIRLTITGGGNPFVVAPTAPVYQVSAAFIPASRLPDIPPM